MARVFCKIFYDPLEETINKEIENEDVLDFNVVSSGRDHVVVVYILCRQKEGEVER